ncbi:hypothetical protein [Sporosarcina sp. Te-1]|uniref:hypothetical protein n=1 Tax=Sporosarcina sp. Te-1 TaxID=2818390 RepID=UPI001A9FBADE|nr:hypothetical protein [Sporosarcina sp. Te-1]QTD41325.1 hypothetical protein J3U78_00165 [Sporosarcina sp. Te-1]
MRSTESNWFIRLGCLSPIIGTIALFVLIRQDSIPAAFLFFAFFFGFAILFLYLSGRAEEKAKQKQQAYLETFKPVKPTYTESHAFVSYDLLSKLAIDEKNRKLYIWVPPLRDGKYLNKVYASMPYEILEYAYKDLLAVEVYENGIRQERFKHPGERTVERLAALGQEWKEGATTSKLPMAKRFIYRKVATLEMKLVLDDEDKPVRIIRFYTNLDKRLSKQSASYNALKKEVEHWTSLLAFIMNGSK